MDYWTQTPEVLTQIGFKAKFFKFDLSTIIACFEAENQQKHGYRGNRLLQRLMTPSVTIRLAITIQPTLGHRSTPDTVKSESDVKKTEGENLQRLNRRD